MDFKSGTQEVDTMSMTSLEIGLAKAQADAKVEREAFEK